MHFIFHIPHFIDTHFMPGQQMPGQCWDAGTANAEILMPVAA